MRKRCELILALDVEKKKDFLYWLDSTRDLLDYYKVGLVGFISLGKEAIRIVKKRRKRVFLDLKFFDIPNTMIKSSINVMRQDIDILDFHLSQDKDSLEFVIDQIRKKAKQERLRVPLLLGVSILTSTVLKAGMRNLIISLCEKAKNSGFDGAILSAKEAELIRRRMGRDFKIACPGIRLTLRKDDQKRISTPQEVKDFADFIIVGRPILEAEEPREVIRKILRILK